MSSHKPSSPVYACQCYGICFEWENVFTQDKGKIDIQSQFFLKALLPNFNNINFDDNIGVYGGCTQAAEFNPSLLPDAFTGQPNPNAPDSLWRITSLKQIVNLQCQDLKFSENNETDFQIEISTEQFPRWENAGVSFDVGNYIITIQIGPCDPCCTPICVDIRSSDASQNFDGPFFRGAAPCDLWQGFFEGTYSFNFTDRWTLILQWDLVFEQWVIFLDSGLLGPDLEPSPGGDGWPDGGTAYFQQQSGGNDPCDPTGIYVWNGQGNPALDPEFDIIVTVC